MQSRKPQSGERIEHHSKGQSRGISRRTILKLGTVGVVSAACSAYASANAESLFTTGDLEISRITLPFQKLPEVFHGFKIAFITDLHHGNSLNPLWIDRIVHAVNRENVDLVLLGGDYAWLPDSPIAQALVTPRNDLFEGLKNLELARAVYSDLFTRLAKIRSLYGTFGVLGNHDRWNFPKSCKHLFNSTLGELLVNERTDIALTGGGVIELYGSDDYWNGLPKKPKFSSPSENGPKVQNTFRIFLTHNPDFLIEECRPTLPANTLCLAGHTHGGQIRLPGIGALVYNVRARQFAYGLHNVDQSYLFTSRGVGVVELPYRVNCPQEIVFINLSLA